MLEEEDQASIKKMKVDVQEDKDMDDICKTEKIHDEEEMD